MKVLVATHATQGQRHNDFRWAIEGELVTRPIIECDNEPVDGRCGCRRSFCGLASRRATTTARVVELDLDRDELERVVAMSLTDGGWTASRLSVTGLTDEILELACGLEVGDVIERRGDTLSTRVLTP